MELVVALLFFSIFKIFQKLKKKLRFLHVLPTKFDFINFMNFGKREQLGSSQLELAKFGARREQKHEFFKREVYCD